MITDTITDWPPVLISALLVGLLCGSLGPYLMWRKLGLLGDALGHSSASAAALAHWLHLNLSVIFIPFGLLVSFLLAWISEEDSFDFSSTLAVVFVGFFALGILGLLGTGESAEELVHLIVGGAHDIGWSDVMTLGVCLVACATYLYWYRRDLTLIAVHQDLAEVSRVPVRRHHYVIVGLSGVGIMLSLKVTGVLLVTSLLMAPPLVTGAFVLGVRKLLWVSPLVGGLTAVLGALLAKHFGLPVGASIAALSFLVLLLGRVLKFRSWAGFRRVRS